MLYNYACKDNGKYRNRIANIKKNRKISKKKEEYQKKRRILKKKKNIKK